jgi:nucleotide-binding universal stress UspA family protein
MNWFDKKKLLVPFDFSEESQEAIDASLQMAASTSNVYVVHVSPDLTISSPEVVWEYLTDDERRENIEKSFHKRFEAAKYHDVNFHVLFGDPGHGIAAYAEEIEADVIVMPSHGRTGLRRLLIGSVAERVLRLAHCPVLILRQ